MSKHDTQFQNMFSLVIGILVSIAIVLFALAKTVGNATQLEHMKSEKLQMAAVEDRTKPFARMAVAGQDNAAMAMAEEPAASAGPAVPKTGEELYTATCSVCHGAGIGGAPKFADKAAWAPRIAKGTPILYDHALHGFQGSAGLMPPKGGRADLPDDIVKAGVDYMVTGSR